MVVAVFLNSEAKPLYNKLLSSVNWYIGPDIAPVLDTGLLSSFVTLRVTMTLILHRFFSGRSHVQTRGALSSMRIKESFGEPCACCRVIDRLDPAIQGASTRAWRVSMNRRLKSDIFSGPLNGISLYPSGAGLQLIYPLKKGSARFQRAITRRCFCHYLQTAAVYPQAVAYDKQDALFAPVERFEGYRSTGYAR
jgi:hypothetical protein